MEELHLYIYDQIGNQHDEKGKLVKAGVMGANIQKQITRAPQAEKIILHINSPGGSVREGDFIHNILTSWKNNTGGFIEARIEYMCASISTRIAAAADKRYIAKNGQWLIHEASNVVGGKADDLRMAATELELINTSLVADYKRMTKKNKGEIIDLMKQDKPISASEAIAWGFCDGYLDEINVTAPTNLTEYSTAVAFYEATNATTTEALAYEEYIKDTLGYKRSEMPQISFEFFDTFLNYFIAKYGVNVVKTGEMPLGKMKPTQSEFNASKVLDKITSGDWSARNYILSKENNLLDGHHDWAAGLEADPKTQVSYTKINLPIADLIAEANALKITKQQSVRSKAKNYINQTKMKAERKTQNAIASLFNAFRKTNPTACADIAPVNMSGYLADGTTVVEYDTLEVGGKVQLVAEDGTFSNPPAGDHTIDGVTVTVDGDGVITAVPAAEAAQTVEALATANARIAELETALATANQEIQARDTTIAESSHLFEKLTAQVNQMKALVPGSGAGIGVGPQNQGKNTPGQKTTVIPSDLDPNSIIGRAAAQAR